MNLHELVPFQEERKSRKRVGRGSATGQGCTSGKGNKGQNSRSGGGVPVWFEGGQMPLQRRLPKRGFKNRFRVSYQVLNLDQISTFFPEAAEVSLEDLYKRANLNKNYPVKILGDGELSHSCKISAHKFSKTAVEKIKEQGGEPISLEG